MIAQRIRAGLVIHTVRGVANYEQFSEFSHAMVKLGHVKNIKNMAAVVDYLTRMALREIEQAEDES